MGRRNRVDPWGRIVAADWRGAFTGNRGVLHDEQGRIVRDQASRAWITCALSWRGRRRELAQPGHWTELFFFDEATALAAGHRPCFTCRRDEAVSFRDLFRRVTHDAEAGAPTIDARLAAERRRPHHRSGSGRRLVLWEPGDVPPGAVVLLADHPHLVVDDGLRRWSPGGYGPMVERPDHEVAVLTPTTTTRVLAAGYDPQVATRAPDDTV